MHVVDRQARSQDIAANIHRKLVRALWALVSVVIVGTVGFAVTEGWTVWHGLYFTLITITTVGYGDEGISETGRIFAIFLLTGGIGASSYTFTLFIQSAVTYQLVWRSRMRECIDKLENHSIICGFGRMGRTICDKLILANKSFVVVERNPDGFRQALELGLLVVEGVATEDEVLFQAGIKNASHLISAVDSEADNIAIALTARDLRPDITIIARAERDEDVRKLYRAGADRVVAPFQSGGIEVANAIIRPKVVDFFAHSQQTENHFVLSEVCIQAGSPLADRQLGEHEKSGGKRIAFVAIERAEEEIAISPLGSETLRSGDILIVAGHPEDVVRMQEYAQQTTELTPVEVPPSDGPTSQADQTLL